ncbi:uncharacterized protein LOC142844824 [Microtus pennsylvanicus]|uniref:uncharacterized protein LOC142844824 n=1 Tax=Microtus pennsylvanicus TaxID=10058 RepID=UPI003F6B68EB
MAFSPLRGLCLMEERNRKRCFGNASSFLAAVLRLQRRWGTNGLHLVLAASAATSLGEEPYLSLPAARTLPKLWAHRTLEGQLPLFAFPRLSVSGLACSQAQPSRGKPYGLPFPASPAVGVTNLHRQESERHGCEMRKGPLAARETKKSSSSNQKHRCQETKKPVNGKPAGTGTTLSPLTWRLVTFLYVQERGTDGLLGNEKPRDPLFLCAADVGQLQRDRVVNHGSTNLPCSSF